MVGQALFQGRGRRAALISAVVVAIVALLGVTAAAWGTSIQQSGRMLPGTTIAGVDVGDELRDGALTAVEAALAERLQHPITVMAGDRTWTVTAAELGAAADVEDAVDRALAAVDDVGIVALARMRFLGWDGGRQLTLDVAAPDARISAFVGQVAAAVDVAARDAELTWAGRRFDVADATIGQSLDRAAAAEALRQAIAEGDDEVVLEVVDAEPDVGTDRARDVAARLAPKVNAVLDRGVVAEIADRTWTTSPRALDATPDLERLLPAAFRGEDTGVPLKLPDESVDEFVQEIASAVRVPARDATAEWRNGSLQVTDGQAGVALAADGARDDVVAALRGGGDRVGLSTVGVQPTLTRQSFDTFLLVNQGERRVYLYRNGDVVRDWPVAVGLAGSDTPTGLFVIGAKRHLPTWHNPSPTGWGRSMPAVIGPGPNNPLGVRALNWNRVGGGDTLIRFHGTPNEASIGEAASRGCVRMFNSDVVQLFDLVPGGTPILSIKGQAPPPPPPDPEPDEDDTEDPEPDEDPTEDPDD